MNALQESKRFNSGFFTQTILWCIIGGASLVRSKLRVQGYWMHIHNPGLHNAFLEHRKFEEAGFTRLPQPLYSLDLARCDFFLFTYLKKELEWRNFRFENEAISAARIILKTIVIRMFSTCLNNRSRGCTGGVQMGESMFEQMTKHEYVDGQSLLSSGR
jgi:hypothetical protein